MGFHDQVWMFLVRRNLKLPPPQSWVKAEAMVFFPRAGGRSSQRVSLASEQVQLTYIVTGSEHRGAATWHKGQSAGEACLETAVSMLKAANKALLSVV